MWGYFAPCCIPWNNSYHILVLKDGFNLLEIDKVTENKDRRSQKGKSLNDTVGEGSIH